MSKSTSRRKRSSPGWKRPEDRKTNAVWDLRVDPNEVHNVVKKKKLKKKHKYLEENLCPLKITQNVYLKYTIRIQALLRVVSKIFDNDKIAIIN